MIDDYDDEKKASSKVKPLSSTTPAATVTKKNRRRGLLLEISSVCNAVDRKLCIQVVDAKSKFIFLPTLNLEVAI